MRGPRAEVEELVSGLGWRQVCAKSFDAIHHVNVQELRALIAELKLLASGSAPKCNVGSFMWIAGSWLESGQKVAAPVGS